MIKEAMQNAETLEEVAKAFKASFPNFTDDRTKFGVRYDEDKNYLAVKIGKLTTRYCDEDRGTIKELDYPEFYDVDIFTLKNNDPSYKSCHANCPYCYLDAGQSCGYVKNAGQIVKDIFGLMTDNQKPFQVALPGSGESVDHPELEDILKAFRELNIEPNCTTNGMWSITDWDKYYEMFEKYCGGIAVTCHTHLKKYWNTLFDKYAASNTKLVLNTHHLISSKKSIDDFIELFNKHEETINTFVLLPLEQSGRQKDEVVMEWDYLVERLQELPSLSKVAFGANFYPWLKDHPTLSKKVDIYEPEIMSGFLRLENQKVYKSSFNWTEKEFQIVK